MEAKEIANEAPEFSLEQRVVRQRTLATVRSAIAAYFGTSTDWFLDQDATGSVQAIGPQGLFPDGLYFAPGLSEEKAKSVVKDAQRWIHQQQNYPPGI